MDHLQKHNSLLTTIFKGLVAALITMMVVLSAVGAIVVNPVVAPVLMLALKAVALAVAVLVIGLNAQHEAPVRTSISLLALGLLCLVVTTIQ